MITFIIKNLNFFFFKDLSMHVCVLSHVQLFATPWIVACQASLFLGILQARMLEWVAMPSSMGDLPNLGIEPRSPTLQADSLPSEPPGKSKNTGAYPFSRRTSWPRNQPGVSCIAGGFFISWATGEAPSKKHTAHQNWIKKKKTIWTDWLPEVNWNPDFKNSPQTKVQDFWLHRWIPPNIQRRKYTNPSQALPKDWRGMSTPETFYEAKITLIPKLDKHTTKKKNRKL